MKTWTLGFTWLTVLLISIPAGARDREHALPAEECEQGWIQLFDGRTLFGWEGANHDLWQIQDGILRGDAQGPPSLLVTTSEFADFVLEFEALETNATNSGVFLRSVPEPKDPQRDCYEVNLCAPEQSPFPTGSLVARQKTAIKQPAPDVWHAYRVTAEGSKISVVIDGEPALEYIDPQPLRRGRIGLQLNAGPIAFRKIRLRPLRLAPLWNGHDLAGWQVAPNKKSRFSFNAAEELEVIDGDGQLESEAEFGDFALQFEVFSHGTALNSGLFFRCIPGLVWQGYECQIQNGYLDGDRARPRDCGTGGIYRRQNARRVVSDDQEWTAITLIVSGKHVATWVNGYQVSDWTDARAENENPRQGCRTRPGTLALQGHDATTHLSFRRMRGVELPAESVNAPKP